MFVLTEKSSSSKVLSAKPLQRGTRIFPPVLIRRSTGADDGMTVLYAHRPVARGSPAPPGYEHVRKLCLAPNHFIVEGGGSGGRE